MAITPILQFRNSDSTRDLNATQARIVDRAIFDGGALTLSGVSLQVSIAPFIAAGYDGIVAISDAVETRSVPAPAGAGPARVSYLVLHLEYRSLTTSIYNLQVIPDTTWATSVSRDYFVTFARFSVPFGATSLTDPSVDVDYSVGDWADKLGKTGWRQPVATVGVLPTTRNRDGDVRIALDTRLAYQWNSSLETWSPIGGAVDLAEVSSRNAESKHQFHRATSGSGLLNEIPQHTAPLGLGATVAGNALFAESDQPISYPFIPVNSVANTGIVPGCHYLMNGHFVKTRARTLTFPAPPGVGERFDLVILEAWRQTISVPSSETYQDETGTPRSFSILRTALERMTEQGGTLASSYDLSEIEAYSSSSFVVTRYQYRVIQNVNVSVLTNTASVAASVTNIDGNAFSVGSNTDQKLWQATSTTSVDARSWALPLVVVRRTSAELAGPPFIDTYRGTQRYVFDVCPRAELGMGLFELEESVRRNQSQTASRLAAQRPSGFVQGTDAEIGISSNTLSFASSKLFVRGRTFHVQGNATLPAPPASGGRTDVVVLEMFQTIYPPNNLAGSAAVEYGLRERIGPHAISWVARFRTVSLPLNALQTTPEGAMTATTFYTQSSGDPYLWERAADPLLGEDPINVVYAVPMALVHRRNTSAYGVAVADQNGANRSAFPGLPNAAATLPYRSEVLDCRARSVLEPEELQHILDESMDRLIAGDLRTSMKPHGIATAVAGTQLLQIDQIAAGATAGTNLIPNPPNGMQTVWAESDEAELFTYEFLNMDVDHADTSGTFTWTAATNELMISLPPGYMLSLDGQNPERPYGPQGYVAYSIDGTGGGDKRPIPLDHVYLTGGVPGGYLIVGDLVTPTPRRQTSVTLTLNAAASATYSEAAARVVICVWAVKRNHEAGRSSGSNSYANNRGLLAVPDKVHRIEYSLSGSAPFSRAWVGAPLNVIDVPVTGDALVITRADLFASGSISTQIASTASDLAVYAVADITLSSTSAYEKVRYIQFTNDAASAPDFQRTRIEFTPGSVPGGTTARVTLVCLGNLVDKWFEVDAGSKQIRGPYTLFRNQFSTTASSQMVGTYVGGVARICGWSDVGLTVWGAFAPGVQQTNGIPGGLGQTNVFQGDLSFYAAGTSGTAWEIWMNAADRLSTRNISIGQTVGLQRALDISGSPGTLMNLGAHSPIFSANYVYTAGAVGNHSSVTVVPGRDPLPSSALVRVFYEYTPYQGLTSNLETRINGIVEGVSDQLVFTSGPNKPWIDYRLLAASLRRGSQSTSEPGLYGVLSSANADIGLLYSKGRVSDRGGLSASDGPTQGTQFVVDDLARPFRTADRPPVAISQRLPFPTKAANGASVGSRYSPESYLSHSVIFDRPVVRPIHVGTGYARSEVGAWVLEYGASLDEQVWRSAGVGKILYFPLPVNIGESIIGLTIEVESAGPAGLIVGTFSTKNRETGVLTQGTEVFYASVASGAGARRLHEVATVPSAPLASNLRSELFLALSSSTSNLRVGQITITVVPNQVFTSANSTIRRFPYDDVTLGVGSTLKKGSRIEVPTTWSTELAAYESAFVQNGRQDVPGVSPSRGRALVTTALGGITYGAGGLLGYVPGADPTTTATLEATAAPGFAGRAVGPRLSAKARTVLTGATAPDVSVGTALGYIVRNDDDVMYMGVSTGYTNITSGTATVRAGQAVDGFVPLGRPVFRRS